MNIKDLLAAARRRLIDRGRPEEGIPRDELEQHVRAVFEAYKAALTESEEPPPRPGMWIFRPRPDPEEFVAAAVMLLERAEDLGREQAAAAAAETADWTCACRCRAHQKAACPYCVSVESCPAHSSPDPREVQP